MLQFEGLVRALGPSLAAARAVLSSSEQGAPHGAKTCADLRVRALVLRYLCAVRPWLLSEREGTPSRMQEASVVRWLTKGSRDRSQKVVLSTLSELIESAGRALAGLGAGGAHVAPLLTQGALLARLGIAPRAQTLSRARPDRAADIAAQAARLTDAAQMGTLFKALAAAGPGQPPLPGFGGTT